MPDAVAENMTMKKAKMHKKWRNLPQQATVNYRYIENYDILILINISSKKSSVYTIIDHLRFLLLYYIILYYTILSRKTLL